MEPYIQISLLNDFIFCPRSIYFHKLYANYSDNSYKDKPQVAGTLAHQNIEDKRYSTRKDILQGTPVFSEQYGIAGKIDIFDKTKGELIERKNKIKKIYDGYRYQVYAQYFCLSEMGYRVNKIFFHSLSDNQRYPVPLPNQKDIQEFESLIQQIRDFDLHTKGFQQNKEKCRNCIYSQLCDFYH